MVGLKVKGGLELIPGKQILLENFPTEEIEINGLKEILNISGTSLATVTTMSLSGGGGQKSAQLNGSFQLKTTGCKAIFYSQRTLSRENRALFLGRENKRSVFFYSLGLFDYVAIEVAFVISAETEEPKAIRVIDIHPYSHFISYLASGHYV